MYDALPADEGMKKAEKVLITGATGFIGFHLASKLVNEGCDVHVVVRRSSETGPLRSLHGTCAFHEHDGSTEGLHKILLEAGPRTIFHLAALAFSRHNPSDIEPLIRSNILFGTQLLDGAVRAGVRNFINTGTYWQHYGGADYNPTCLYAATKQAFEDILLYYTGMFPLASLTLKIFDTYGPSDRRNKLFALLRRAHLTGEKLVMSPGEQRIDLVYIDDVVRAFMRAADLLCEDRGVAGRSFSVRTGRTRSVREVVSLYEGIVGDKLSIQWGGRPYEPRQIMVPSEGETLPGWSPLIDLEEGIRLTLEADPTRSAGRQMKFMSLSGGSTQDEK